MRAPVCAWKISPRSKCGDKLMRHALFEAANAHLRRSRKWLVLRAWGVKLAKHIGARKACVAAASLRSSCTACGSTRRTSGSGNLRPRERRKGRPGDLLCRGHGEDQSVTIPVRCTHQVRAVSLDDLTRRTPSWSEPCGRLRTEARAG